MRQTPDLVKPLMDAAIRNAPLETQLWQGQNDEGVKRSKFVVGGGTTDVVNPIALFALLQLGGTPLVDAAAIPGLRVDLRYAGARNIAGQSISTETRCWLRPEAAAALRRAEATLARQGLTLLAWDCYRTREAQQKLWDKQPTPGLVANPKTGSNHNRGVAIDLTLARADGTPLEMPTDFDDFTARAARDATNGISAAALANRALLRRAMVAAGFTTIRREWWHFDLAGARAYPLLGNESAR